MLTQAQLIASLEPLVDQSDLSAVLLALGRVCNEKAEHIRENWQDKITAGVWDRAAKAIDQVAVNNSVTTVS